MTPTDSCPSCGRPRATRYCPHCGERAVAPDELSLTRFLRALTEEIIPGLEGEDDSGLQRAGGRVYRTVYTLFRRPGLLTADYIAGRRRPYLKPMQVYLTISLIFFLLGTNYFRYSLGEYEYVPVLAETADDVAAEVKRLDVTPAAYRSRFDTRLEVQKKAAIAVLIPIFAVGLVPLYRRRRYGEHLIFSIHFFAALLLFMVIGVKLFFLTTGLVLRGLFAIAPGWRAPVVDVLSTELFLVSFIYLGALWYLYLALRRVYGGGRWVTLALATVLAVWHLVLLVNVFRTGLFYTTYYSIKWFG